MIYRLLLGLLLFSPEAAFADKPTLSAPVLLEAENLGDVWVYLKPQAAVDVKSLLPALTKVLTPAALADISAALRGRELAAFSDLDTLGVHLRFDETALVVQASLEDGLRARKNLRVRPGDGDERDTAGPEAFSGYINATTAQSFVYPKPNLRQPFHGNLGLVSNYRGLVLETGSIYQEKDPNQWRRDDTRLVRDFEASLLRASVGDLPVLTTGYQNSRPLGGISVTRQYSIQPYLNIRPLNRTEILVKRPSIIEVYVNDGFVNRVNASPGPVQLSDFPLFSGINKVDLKVIDDAGAVEWINLNLLYDTQLLGSGVQQFAYHVGAPSEQFGSDRRYDGRNLTSSLFHRVGVNDRLTVGASFQQDKNLWLAGQEFAFLTHNGLVSGESGVSHWGGGDTSGAGRLRFRSLDYKLGADKPFRSAAEVEYKGARFAALGQTDTLNDFSWHYTLSASKPLTAVTSTGLSLEYLVNRLGGDDRRSARLDFTSEFTANWRTSLSYTAEKENGLNHRFQVVITWLEPDGKFFGNLSYDYPTKTTRLEASRSPSSFVGDVRATVGAQNSPAAAQGDALIEYTHEKANLRAEQLSRHERVNNGYQTTTHTSTLTASTAVAWAGGAVGWTRPVSDSFVILKARPLYRDYLVPVNRVENSAEATVNRFGPGVVPTLSAYNETPVTLDSSNLPVGYTLGKEYLLARPTYRSGIRLDIGGDSTVVMTGRLLLPGNKPASLLTAEVRRGGKFVSTLFTNREGIFLLENLNPGDYEIVMDDGDFAPIPIKVNEDQAGFVHLAPIQLKGNP